ncbi:hypothetical protein ABEF95_000676 [Exophiala dermatitidis]
MAAQQYGARLLEEVQEENLENCLLVSAKQLLADLRHIVNPTPESVLGIPQLDEVLESVWSAANQPQPDNTQRQRGWIPILPAGTRTRRRNTLPLNQDTDDENENAGPGAGPLAIDSDDAQDEDIVDAQDHHGDDHQSHGHPQPPLTPRRQAIGKPKLDPPAATIELSSPKSAAGKTTLLYYLCAKATLPIDSGGKGSTVVYVDSDGRFSASRLMQVMEHYIATRQQKQSTTTPGDVGSHSLSKSIYKGKDPDKPNNVNINITTNTTSNRANESESESDTNSIALEALQHIHVFRPQSSTQVMTILQSLPEFLFDRSRIQSSVYRQLGLLVLDSAAAFYWQDRLDRDMGRLGGTESSGMPAAATAEKTTTTTTTSEIIECLKTLQRRFDCVVAFTTTNHSTSASQSQSHPHLSSRTDPASVPTPAASAANRPGHDAPSAPAREPNPVTTTQWSTYATMTLDLSRIPVPQFPPGLPLAECLADADKRFAAMRNTRIQVRVRVNTTLSHREAHAHAHQHVQFLDEDDNNEQHPRAYAAAAAVRRKRAVPTGTAVQFVLKITDEGVDVEAT